MQKSFWRTFLVVFGVCGLILLGWRSCAFLTGTVDSSQQKLPEDLIGIVLPEPRPLKEFSLLDQNGAPFNLERVTGKWSFFFFGYTHCPDVCPVAMGELAEVFTLLQKTPKALQGVQGVFVSVDPERDTPKLLKEYVAFFNPEFLGVTGKPEDIHAFAKQLMAYYSVTPKSDKGDAEISHTSVFCLVDPNGRFAGLFQPQQLHTPTVMADLFIKIRRYYGEMP